MTGRITHGQSRANKKTKLYMVWHGMKQRCYYGHHIGYKNYGGRGITVCERWRTSFENFFADMGNPPLGMSLERIDNDGPYSPENCRWATHAEQHSNTSRARLISFGGKTLCLRGWERALGLGRGTVSLRLKRGLPIQEVLRPSKKQLPHDGCTLG